MTSTDLTLRQERSRDRQEVPISERGPAPVDVVASFGFWLFLLSDIVIFSAMFAAYAVLVHASAGGLPGIRLFDRQTVLIETICLLMSSFTCGLATIATDRKQASKTYLWAAVTFLLGSVFLGLEIREFAGLIADGNGPTRSAFLSAFFLLVGTHGAHVAIGLVWLAVMMAQVATLGFRPMVVRRLVCFALFWHALDIVWIGVFTIVYLGAYG